MGVFTRWLDWVSGAPGVAASTSEPSVVFSADIPTPVDDAIVATQRDLNLMAPVTRDQALSVEAVLRGRNLICSIATLPLEERNKAGKVIESKLLEQPDPNVPNVVFWASLIEDMIFEGIAWTKAVEWDAQGYPTKITKLDVKTVSTTPPRDIAKGLRTLPSGFKLPVGTVWVEGVPTPPRDALGRPVIIRWDSPNPGVLRAAARAIRRLLLLEASSARYADNPRAQDYFAPAEAGTDPLDDDEIKAILTAWRKARKEGSTGYVPAALLYHTVDSLTPVELQIIEQQKQALLSIANALGLDPEDLGISTTSRTYQNGVDRRMDRVNDVFSMYMCAITDRLKMQDLTRRGHTVGYNLDEYLKADPKTRWETHKIGVELGAVTIAEVREVEGLDPNAELEKLAKQKALTPAAAPQDEVGRRRAQREVAASAPVAQNFDRTAVEDDTEAEITFAMSSEDMAEFSTDLESRTITGLMVPWNKVNTGTYAKWRFKKGSLAFTDVSRIKLNMDHDRRSAVGYATRVWETSKGLMGTFKVTTHSSGDDALLLASDKVKDGFSIEVTFPAGAESWSVTEVGDGEYVRDVRHGQLTGCALTAAPSFDDARLTGVKASRSTNGKDGSMDPEDNKGGGTLTMTPEVQAAFSTAVADGVKAAVEGVSEHFEKSIQALIDAQQKPGAVNPTGGPGAAQFEVKEAPVYRFDGIRGEHDFSTDLIAAHKNSDGEALKRANVFMGEYFANREFNAKVSQLAGMIQQQNAAFAVTTSNVASLNPSINRPDMYVDQLQYPTPIWDAIRKGTITDNTPFVLPKFNASSGLVADHVQGTEPTPGALTTTSQTITPSAVSGKVEVTREAWDQGGNPQLSVILWRQMVRAWDEALELGASALLEGLTVTTVTLTDGAEDDVLVDEVTGSIVDLHFIRGGFRFQDFFLEKGLYKRLSQAKDGDGRKLLPILGPQNADGSAGPLMASLNVAGLAGRPAWALPYTAGAENDSYIFNREDVHGWASAPQRLDFEYRVAFVDIALWGYKAFACTRTDGVRKFAYDETA